MIPHKTASAFFLTVLAPLAVAVTSSPASQEAFADAVTRLPANMFYEEADDAFYQRLMAGRFWFRDTFFYLAITGDGSFGKRLFIWDGKQTITVIHFCADDDEDGAIRSINVIAARVTAHFSASSNRLFSKARVFPSENPPGEKFLAVSKCVLHREFCII